MAFTAAPSKAPVSPPRREPRRHHVFRFGRPSRDLVQTGAESDRFPESSWCAILFVFFLPSTNLYPSANLRGRPAQTILAAWVVPAFSRCESHGRDPSPLASRGTRTAAPVSVSMAPFPRAAGMRSGKPLERRFVCACGEIAVIPSRTTAKSAVLIAFIQAFDIGVLSSTMVTFVRVPPPPVPGRINSTREAGGAPGRAVLRRPVCDSAIRRLSLPYSRRRTLPVRALRALQLPRPTMDLESAVARHGISAME